MYSPVPEPSADFDGDGNVNGDDFLIWQSGFGVDDTGDADGDGDTDGDDFLIWQSEFGSGNGAVECGGAGASVDHASTHPGSDRRVLASRRNESIATLSVINSNLVQGVRRKEPIETPRCRGKLGPPGHRPGGIRVAEIETRDTTEPRPARGHEPHSDAR